MKKIYFDKKMNCPAVEYNGEVEHFNHETQEHNWKNAKACYDLLDTDEQMHEYLEWEEDFAVRQAEMYEDII